MYKFLRAVLFLFDAEAVHYFAMNCFKFFCKIPFVRSALRSQFSVTTSTQQFLGLNFTNRVGLAAGFDKNAKYLNELEIMGFGFVEIGTVTPLLQEGNDKPRLFRLPKDKALINRMGFNNDGAESVAARLKEWRVKKSSLIIGGNIGKNKITTNDNAWKDYEICFNALHPYVDYFVVNVSSPNTPGLRELQEKDSLKKILTNLQQQNKKHQIQRPVLLKIAPDLTIEQVNDVVALAMEIQLDGLIVANTTISRQNLVTDKSILDNIGGGGLSGDPLKSRTKELVNYISKKTNNKLFLIASGGIFTATDAKDNLSAGASLVQVWTGFIYEGPLIVKNICNGL